MAAACWRNRSMRVYFQYALLVVAAFYAWRRGEWPEKAVAATLIAILLADFPVHWVFGWADYNQLHVGHAAIDVAGTIALLAIALKADRIWTLFAASAQLVALAVHPLRMIALPMDPLVYAVMTRAPFYLLILTLLFGTWLHDQRARRAAPSSNVFLPPS